MDAAARRAVTGHADANLLALFPLVPAGTQFGVVAGQQTPCRGWLPGTDNRLTPAPQLTLRLPRMNDARAEFITVLVPFAGTQAPALSASAQAPGPGVRPGWVRLAWGDGTTDEIHYVSRAMTMLGDGDGWATDGGLLHLRRDAAGRVLGGVAADATWVAPYAPAPRPAPGLLAFGPAGQ